MKITEAKRKEALELAKKLSCKELFINVDGEFFTNQSHAANSVKNDKEKWAKVDLGIEVEPQKTTNDLGKAADVIAAIEAATEVSVIEAISKAEAEGKNRKSVIDAAAKKIESLSNNAQ
jgi:hypothetical protein